MSNFSEVLKTLRKKNKITQADLAKKIKISRSSIGMYENGEREPDFETLESIADYFNVDMNFLYGRQWEDIIYPKTSGIIKVEDELEGLISRLKTSDTATFREKEMDESAKAMLQNSLEGLLQNLELIVKK